MGIISSEEQLRNVARCVLANVEIKRHYTGRGRRREYAADPDTIADSARQLAEMVLAMLDGNLTPINGDDLPF